MKNLVKYKKTSQQIKNTFFELIQTTPIEKIRINDICDILSINRSTFYRHYDDIYALLSEIESEYLEQLQMVYKSISVSSLSSEEAMKIILSFIKENKEASSIVFVYQIDMRLWEKFNELSTQLFISKIFQKFPNSINCDQRELRQTIQFVSSGFYYLYKNWIMDDCHQAIDDLAKRLASLSDICIQQVLSQQEN